MIKEYIEKLSNGHSLTFDEAKLAMDMILDDRVTPVQTAAFLTALHIKGESIEEITGSAMSLREHAERIDYPEDTLEIAGTAGDAENTFTIAVASGIVAAAGECKLAAHGSRSAISRCGPADILEALGININCSAEESTAMLDKSGFCFLYAQKYHCAMKYITPVRTEIGIRNVFDVLGALSNPACSEKQLLGVYDEELLKPMAQVLINLGVKRGMCVHGLDGEDEISACSPTRVCEITDGRVESYTVNPEDFGFVACSANELKTGDAQDCARIIRDVFFGKERGGMYSAVCINAGAAIYLDGKAGSLEEGVAVARKLIDAGKAREKLDEIIELSGQTSGA